MANSPTRLAPNTMLPANKSGVFRHSRPRTKVRPSRTKASTNRTRVIPDPGGDQRPGRRPQQVDEQRPDVEPERQAETGDRVRQALQADDLAERPEDRVGDGVPDRPAERGEPDELPAAAAAQVQGQD